MEVKGRFFNRIGVLAMFALAGIVGAAVLYYGMFFVLALVNYFDGVYKHDAFYQLYPTAVSYLATFFATGTLKHLPGYEIEFNLGIPLLFGCGMVLLGILLAILLRKNGLEVTQERIHGKPILGKTFDAPAANLQQARLWPLWGLLLRLDGRNYLFLFLKNRVQVLEALEQVKVV